MSGLAALGLGDEEDLAARANRLEISGLVALAVDRDGRFSSRWWLKPE